VEPKNKINIDCFTFEVFKPSILVLNHSRIARGLSVNAYVGIHFADAGIRRSEHNNTACCKTKD
jgi:hypothetical protein